MSKIPKEIVDKIEQRNQLNKELRKWCMENLDIESVYIDCAKITDFHEGQEQWTDDCKEWCDQTTICEDWYRGTYYWETEYEGKYLAMDYET